MPRTTQAWRVSLYDVETAFIECRRPLGHAWWEINPPRPKAGSKWEGHELVSVACDRCATQRHEAWHRKTGVLIGRRYRRPTDYQAIARDVKANDMRLELIRRYKTRSGAAARRAIRVA